MVLPLVISLLAPELIERIVKAREDIIFNLQDWISDCLFSGFLCEEADAFDKIHDYMEIMDKFIKAYCFIIPLPILVAYAGEEIMKDEVLLNYFWQFPSVREHLELQASGVPFSFTGYDEELLDNVARFFPEGDKAFKKWKEESGSIFDFFNIIWDTINSFWQALGEDPMSFVNHVLQEFSQADYPAFLFNIPRELIFVLNPFIEIDWVVIKTAIQCYYAFEKYSLNAELAKYPKAFVEGQRIWLENNGEIIAKTELDAEGHFKLEAPITTEKFTNVRINTHGLIYMDEIMEICRRSKWVECDTNTVIPMDDVKYNHVRIFTLPDFRHVADIGSQDSYQRYKDLLYHSDVYLRIFEYDDFLEVQIFGVTGDHSNWYYYNDKPVCLIEKEKYCHPWRKDIEDHNPRCTIKIDKRTYEII